MMETNSREYQYSLFWNDGKDPIFLGDHFTKEDAKAEIKMWCKECEDEQARNPVNYMIKKYGECE
jgi:hypothetical protein